MKFAVCAIARLENNYIREWVEHYKTIGFDSIILYDNNRDGEEYFTDVIYDYIMSGFVILKNYRNKVSSKTINIQTQAYSECFNEYKTQYDWILYVDIDEFLMFNKFNTIKEYLLSYTMLNNINSICFCWKYFDDNGLICVENNNYNCKDRFTHSLTVSELYSLPNINKSCDDWNVTAIKQLIHTNHNVTNWWAHGERTLYKSVYADFTKVLNLGESFKTNKYDIAWINHYRYKTIGEYMHTKMIRHWPDNHMGERAKQFLTDLAFFKFNTKTPDKEKYYKEHL